MIGHYLLSLTEEQEDRVLTTRLAYAPMYWRADGCRCLVGTVADVKSPSFIHTNAETMRAVWEDGSVGGTFDKLCRRFGEERVNAAIRNRILSNRARRLLGASILKREEVPV